MRSPFQPQCRRVLTKSLSKALLEEQKKRKDCSWKSLIPGASDFGGAILAAFLQLTTALSYVGILCISPALHPLFLPLVLSTICSLIIGGIPFMYTTQYVTVASLDSLVAQMLAAAAKTVSDILEGDPHSQLTHAFLVIPLFTIGLGVVNFFVGSVKGGLLLKFIPYIVLSGMLGGFGLIILYNGWQLALGMPVQQFFDACLHALQGDCSFQERDTIRLATLRTALLAFTIWASGLCETGPLGKPLLLFFLTCGMSLAEHFFADSSLVQAPGWYMPLQKESGSLDLLAPWKLMADGLINFKVNAFFNGLVLNQFVAFISLITIKWALQLPANDKVLLLSNPDKIMDHDREIKYNGLSNFVCGLLSAGHPIVHAFSAPLAVYPFAGMLWREVMTIILFGLLYTGWWTFVVKIPQFAFAGLVAAIGYSLLLNWLVRARGRIAANEWRLLALTSFAIWYNALMGICLGVCVSLVFFVVEYSGVAGIKKVGTLKDYHSNVDRSLEELRTIEQFGDQVALFWLEGYLYFGSVAKLKTEVRHVVDRGARTVVLDLSYVPAVDACGVYGLVDLGQEIKRKGCSLMLAGMVRRLKLALESAEQQVLAEDEEDFEGKSLRFACDLDAALSRCEDVLLKRCGVARPSPWPKDANEVWGRLLGQPCPELAKESVLYDVPANTILFRQSDVATELIVVLSGKVVVETMPLDKYCVRLPNRSHLNVTKGDKFVFEGQPERRTACPGSVIGVVECSRSLTGRSVNCFGTARAMSGLSVLRISHEAVRRVVKSQNDTNLFLFWLLAAMTDQASPNSESEQCVSGLMSVPRRYTRSLCGNLQ